MCATAAFVRLGDVGGRKGRTGIAQRLARSAAGRPFGRNFKPGGPSSRSARDAASVPTPSSVELDRPGPPPSADKRHEDPCQQDNRRDASANPASRGA